MGTDVDTELGFVVFKAVYAWSFRQTEDFDASLSIGVHGMDIRLDAVGTIVDRPVDRQTSDRRFPLPVLGLNASKRLGGRWTLTAGADLFALDFDEVEGHLADARVTMDLAVTENLAFSFGFNWVDIDFDSDSEKFLGTLDYRYWTGTAAVKLMF